MAVEAGRVLYSLAEPAIAVLTINRPEKRNAQDTDMVYALNSALDQAAADNNVRVIVLRAAGNDFSSGHDLLEQDGDRNVLLADLATRETIGTWANFTEAGAAGTYARDRELFSGMVERWRTIPKPIIGQVQGRCIAGGLNFIWACDVIVASDDAKFRDHVLLMGLRGCEFFGHPWEFGIRVAKEMLFTSEWVSAAEAHALGMVNKVVPKSQLDEAVLAMARAIAKKSSFALKMTKLAVDAADGVRGRGTAQTLGTTVEHLLYCHNSLVHGTHIDPNFVQNSAVDMSKTALGKAASVEKDKPKAEPRK